MAAARASHVPAGGAARALFSGGGARGRMEPTALERFHSPGKGNGLRSRRRVRPGELLYRDVPFAYVLSKEQLGSVCERCLRRYRRERGAPPPPAPPGSAAPSAEAGPRPVRQRGAGCAGRGGVGRGYILRRGGDCAWFRGCVPPGLRCGACYLLLLLLTVGFCTYLSIYFFFLRAVLKPLPGCGEFLGRFPGLAGGGGAGGAQCGAAAVRLFLAGLAVLAGPSLHSGAPEGAKGSFGRAEEAAAFVK